MEEIKNQTQDLHFKTFLQEQAVKVTFANNQINWAEMQQLDVRGILSLKLAKMISRNCISLKKLIVQQCDSKLIFDQISNIPSLIDLQFHFPLPSTFATATAQFKNLKRFLWNYHKRNKQDFLETVKNMPELESIAISVQIDEQIIESLKSLKYLKEVEFLHINFSSVISVIRALPQLRSLRLRNAPVSNSQLQQITQSNHNLKQLGLSFSYITQEGIKSLKYLSSLEKLEIQFNQIKCPSAMLFVAYNFSSLKQLTVSLDYFSSESLQAISLNFKLLESFKGQSQMRTPQFTLSSFHQFLSHLTALRYLQITRYHNSRTALIIHRNLKNLIRINLELSREGFKNQGCFYLSKVKCLKQVSLAENRISEIGIMKLLRNIEFASFQFRRWFYIESKIKRNFKIFQFSRHSLVDI